MECDLPLLVFKKKHNLTENKKDLSKNVEQSILLLHRNDVKNAKEIVSAVRKSHKHNLE